MPRVELLGAPLGDLQDPVIFLIGDPADGTIGVAPDVESGDPGIHDAVDRRSRERPPREIAAEHDQVHPHGANVLQDGLERGHVAVDVVERGDPCRAARR